MRTARLSLLLGLVGLVGLAVVGGGACGGSPVPSAASGPVIAISLHGGGAGAAALEREAVEPIEQAVAGLAGVRSLRSTIEPGHAHVEISFEASRPLDLATDAVMRTVREAQRQLPAGLAPPVISRVDPAGPVLWFELEGDAAPRAERSELARDVVKPRLERLPGVGAIELAGGVERVIAIRPDLARLAAAGVTLAELAAVVPGTLDVPSGRIDPTSKAVIRIVPAPVTLEGLGELAVASRDGATVRVRDVARLAEETAADDPGGPLALGMRLQQGADREEVLARVRAALADLRRALPPGFALVERPPPPVAPAPVPAPLAVSVRGPDRTVLRTIAAKLEADLRAAGGASEVTRDPPPGRPEQTIELDRARAAQLGISSAELAAATRALLSGEPLGTLRVGGRERAIVLRLDGSVTERLAQTAVRTASGELVGLAAVATVTATLGEALLRVDGEPAIELSARVAPGEARAAVRRRLVEATRDLAPGYRAVVAP
ncbi:MAG TPA: efflux RND transporter permease subunit [Kofleriaceae bacterium]|nr:efflux RND transporter permease subunit [Kofleriaceae bacterium]